MFESSTLFYVILGILALITACLLLIAYEMTRREVGRTSLHARKRSEALKECAYFFGFLSEQPVGKLIPDECFGCTLALSCIKVKKPPSEDKIKQENQVPVP